MYANIVFILSFLHPNTIIDDLIFRVSAFIAVAVFKILFYRKRKSESQ